VKLNEYRMTRNSLYGHNCIGRDDLSARNGHYITAGTEHEARVQMNAMYPADAGDFTCQLWKEDVYVCSTLSLED